jgi:excisionase family DNA binding protein
MSEPYVGATALAEHLNDMSPLTVRQWARVGKIPGIKPGKEWLFRISEVDAHLNSPNDDPWAQSAQSRGRRRAK